MQGTSRCRKSDAQRHNELSNQESRKDTGWPRSSYLTIIPFLSNGWDPAAGFPARAGEVPFLMKDIVLVSKYHVILPIFLEVNGFSRREEFGWWQGRAFLARRGSRR